MVWRIFVCSARHDDDDDDAMRCDAGLVTIYLHVPNPMVGISEWLDATFSRVPEGEGRGRCGVTSSTYMYMYLTFRLCMDVCWSWVYRMLVGMHEEGGSLVVAWWVVVVVVDLTVVWSGLVW